ncbi:amidohydrolase family protein [Paraburkholderia sp. MM5482-R1]|uniref:metal-dependent hydrolase family protein n=1 Tax=unclassified Paraburkholderia TaxID=2615204 RepID=UPI003D1FBE8E
MHSSTIFKNFLFLDPRRDSLQEGFEIRICDGKVVEVFDHSSGDREGVQVIDLGGRTLMPGLIDAHVHVFMNERNIGALRDVPQTYMTAKAAFVMRGMLMRGFTTVRDVAGGDYGTRDAVNAGYLDAPRLFVGGRAISQTGGHGDFRTKTEPVFECACCNGLELFSRVADGVPDVLKAVREELRLGADHIKLMLSGGVASPNDPLESIQFRDDEIEAAVDEARRWGVYVAAHAYSDEAIRRAVRLGIRTVEHGNFLTPETARLMASEKVFLVPTLIVYAVNKALGSESGKSPASLEKNEKVLAAGLMALECARAEGVAIGFGTDLSMHTQAYQCDGLKLHAKVLSNAEVIRAATVTNAAILKQSGVLGELVLGANADLLVVEGDPYHDLSLFDADGTSIRAVMKGGKFFKNAL